MYNDYSNMLNTRAGYSYMKRGNTVVDEEVITLTNATNLIRNSINDELADEMFYTALIEKAPNDEIKKIISDISNDEKRHNEILRYVYSNITGEMFENKSEENAQKSEETTYEEDINRALFGELDAIKKYRKIMGAMPNMKNYTLLMSILTDEIRHANIYNYLIAKQMNRE